MTADELRNYRYLCAEIDALQEELRQTYYNVRGISYDRQPGSGTPGNPTAAAAGRAMELQEMLESRLNRRTEERIRIEKWIETIGHPERDIVQLHFVNGLTWRETAVKLWGTSCGEQTPRMIFNRFIKRQGQAA